MAWFFKGIGMLSFGLIGITIKGVLFPCNLITLIISSLLTIVLVLAGYFFLFKSRKMAEILPRNWNNFITFQ